MIRATIRWTRLTAACLAVLTASCAAPEAPGAEERSAAPISTPAESAGLRRLNGTELFVKRLGAGDPVLVVHGGPMLEHGYLLPHLAPLATDYELVFADQRVSGRSAADAPPESLRIATLVADIEALRRDLGLERVHLLAHSWGGLLAMHYALEHPSAVRTLILVSPMSASSELWQREQQAQAAAVAPEDQAARQEILESEAFARQDPAAIEALLRLAFEGQFHDRERAAELELYVPDDYMARSRLFGQVMTDISDYDLHPRLGALDVPTLILFGADEPGAAIGGAALEAALPGSSRVVLEASGHFPFIERRDAFLEHVRGFLEQVGEEP